MDQLRPRWRSAVDFVSGGAVSHDGEALALLEGVDETRIRQSTVGGHPHRLLEDCHPYVIADVARQSAHLLRTFGWEAAFSFVLRSWEAESWVGVGARPNNLGCSRIVGWVE
jgi:hypothetical protein